KKTCSNNHHANNTAGVLRNDALQNQVSCSLEVKPIAEGPDIKSKCLSARPESAEEVPRLDAIGVPSPRKSNCHRHEENCKNGDLTPRESRVSSHMRTYCDKRHNHERRCGRHVLLQHGETGK